MVAEWFRGSVSNSNRDSLRFEPCLGWKYMVPIHMVAKTNLLLAGAELPNKEGIPPHRGAWSEARDGG